MHIQNNDTTSATSQNYILPTIKIGCVNTYEYLELMQYEYQKNINQYCRYVCPAYLMTQNIYVLLLLQMPLDLISVLALNIRTHVSKPHKTINHQQINNM